MNVIMVIVAALIGAVLNDIYTHFTKIKRLEENVRQLRMNAEGWEMQARHWETESIKAKDNERCAVQLQQYWRARQMNQHFGFNEACDANGPAVVYRDEQNDICDGLVLAAKDAV